MIAYDVKNFPAVLNIIASKGGLFELLTPPQQCTDDNGAYYLHMSQDAVKEIWNEVITGKRRHITEARLMEGGYFNAGFSNVQFANVIDEWFGEIREIVEEIPEPPPEVIVPDVIE